MWAKLDEVAAVARAAEGCAVDGQPARALMIALDVEPLAIEANRLDYGRSAATGRRVTMCLNRSFAPQLAS